MRSFAKWLLFLSLSVWLGAAVYFSFFAANQVFARLPEDQAAAVVKLLFPTFFRLCAITSVLVFFLYWLLASRQHRLSYWAGWVLALTGTLSACANAFFLLPRIEQIEQKMGPISRAPHDLVAQFGMLHGISMILDLTGIVAAALIWLCLSAQTEFAASHRGW